MRPIAHMKAHPALIPLFFCVGVGVAGAGFYIYRLATRSIDCSWNQKTNPQPWNTVKVNEQMKFYAPTLDYKELKNPEGRPILPPE